MTQATPSDEDLILSLQQGESQALAQLSDRFYRRVMQFMLSRIRHWDQALDLSQDVFVAIAKRCQEYNPSYTASSWIFLLARDRCADALRSDNRNRRAMQALALQKDQDDFHANDPNEDFLLQELTTSLQQLIQNLPEPGQTTLRLRLQGLTFAAIAKRLGQPESTVKHHISIITNKLKNSLNS